MEKDGMNEFIDEIVKIIKDNLTPSPIRYIYKGEVDMVQQSLLPAAVVIPKSSLYDPKYTGFDLVTYTATVAVIDDIKRSAGQSPKEASGISRVMAIMEKTTNGALNAKTVVYLLRRYVTLSGKITEGIRISTVEYSGVMIGAFLGVGARCDLAAKTRIAVSRE